MFEFWAWEVGLFPHVLQYVNRPDSRQASDISARQ